MAEIYFPQKIVDMIKHMKYNVVDTNGRIYLFKGHGSNGKTTVVNAIKKIFNAVHIPYHHQYKASLNSLRWHLINYPETKLFIINFITLREELIDLMHDSGRYLIIDPIIDVKIDMNRINEINFDITFVDNPRNDHEIQAIPNIDLFPILNSLWTN